MPTSICKSKNIRSNSTNIADARSNNSNGSNEQVAMTKATVTIIMILVAT